MESGQIGKWNKQPGDGFSAGDIFCEVQTDKATVDFEAQDDGFVAKLLVEAGGADIKVGDPIMIICDSADSVAAFKDYVLQSGTALPPAPKLDQQTPPAPASSSPAPSSPPTPPPAPISTSASSSSSSLTKASPLAFKLAKETGHEISAIPGTGPGGRVLAADVKEYVPPMESVAATMAAAAPTALAVPSQPAPMPISGAGFTDYPLSVDAQQVAARLVQSKRNVPHYYLTVDLNLESILELRSTLNKTLANSSGISISLNDMLVKAAACAMKAVPEVNASWMDTFVRVYDNVDINVISGSGDGLVTPLITAVNTRGLASIAQAIAQASSAAAQGTLPPQDCAIGTFAIINLGMYGVKSAAPIIMEPQACMLALGAAENRIVPSDDPETLYKQSVMLTATMSCDHRVVDGAVGAQWLAAFKSHVENPTTLLL